MVKKYYVAVRTRPTGTWVAHPYDSKEAAYAQYNWEKSNSDIEVWPPMLFNEADMKSWVERLNAGKG